MEANSRATSSHRTRLVGLFEFLILIPGIEDAEYSRNTSTREKKKKGLGVWQ